MSKNFMIPEEVGLIQALEPQTNAGALAGDYISLKLAHKVLVIFHMTQGNAAQAVLSLTKATDVAATGEAAVTATFPIYYNLDCTTDIFTRATDAANYTLDVGLANKLVVFVIDPSILGAYDCLAAAVGASNASNIVAVTYQVLPRYAGDGLPSMISD